MRTSHGLRLVFYALLAAAFVLGISAAPAFSQGEAGTTLSASVDATSHWMINYSWTLDKSVTPAIWNLFRGDSGTSLYTITANRETGEEEAYVNGEVCVSNGGGVATEGLAITAVLENGYSPANTFLTSAPVDVSGKPVLAPGETHCYAYQVDIPFSGGAFPQPHPGGDYKITADVTITNHSGSLGIPKGPSPKAAFTFLTAPVEVHGSLIVTDSNGSQWTFNDDGVQTYSKTFTCGGDEGNHPNTVTSVYGDGGSGPSDSAAVMVNCYALDVSKTAVPSYKRSYSWTIDKVASPSTLNMFSGDTGSAAYAVTINASYVDSNWKVDGVITIDNNTPLAAVLTGVADTIQGVGAADVNCHVSFPYTLPAGDDLDCDYSKALPNTTTRLNTATATLQNYNYSSALVATPDGTTDFTGTKDIVFGEPTTLIDECVNVTDPAAPGGTLGSFCIGQHALPYTFNTYSKAFTCDGDEGAHPNTATLTTTDTSTVVTDTAAVTVNCYALEVTKNADESYTRTYAWDILKASTTTELTLSIGQQFLVAYTVTPSATFADSAWAVSGSINIANPAPIAATITAVNDLVSGAGAAVVTCPVSLPYLLPAGETLVCSYALPLPDATSRVNTATATLQNVPLGTTEFSGSANVVFGAPTSLIDECIDITDDQLPGFTQHVCYGDLPMPIPYNLTVGPYAACGEYTFTNIATSTTIDQAIVDTSSVSIPVHVPCVGCTLTQGYWKTHSIYGPAPYDDTWTFVGEDIAFYLSGKTYYQVMWTAPSGGNVYYQLAHQFIASWLNIFNGASHPSSIDNAMIWAGSFFNNHAPADKLSRPDREMALYYAHLLAMYNEGAIGPGHCSE